MLRSTVQPQLRLALGDQASGSRQLEEKMYPPCAGSGVEAAAGMRDEIQESCAGSVDQGVTRLDPALRRG